MTQRQKIILDGLVNQWNDLLLEWNKDKSNVELKRKLDEADRRCKEYESSLGLNDDDYYNFIIK